MVKPIVFHSGWVAIGKHRSRHGKTAARAQLNITVRVEPDPRFVFEFDGEPECSPQVLQVKGSMKQPMFTCKFSCRSNSNLRSRSVLRSPPLQSNCKSSLNPSSMDVELTVWNVGTLETHEEGSSSGRAPAQPPLIVGCLTRGIHLPATSTTPGRHVGSEVQNQVTRGIHTADTLAATSPKPATKTTTGVRCPVFQILECMLPSFVLQSLG